MLLKNNNNDNNNNNGEYQNNKNNNVKQTIEFRVPEDAMVDGDDGVFFVLSLTGHETFNRFCNDDHICE